MLAEKWYEEISEVAIGNNNPKMLWDFMIPYSVEIENREPQIVLIEKYSKICWVIDKACQDDKKLCDRKRKGRFA